MFGGKIKHLTILIGSFACIFFGLNVRAQENIQFSQGKVEEGMNTSFGIPLMSYKERGIHLPVSINYSSNVWRIDNTNTVYNNQFTQTKR
jgi:hypothetical protein